MCPLPPVVYQDVERNNKGFEIHAPPPIPGLGQRVGSGGDGIEYDVG